MPVSTTPVRHGVTGTGVNDAGTECIIIGIDIGEVHSDTFFKPNLFYILNFLYRTYFKQNLFYTNFLYLT